MYEWVTETEERTEQIFYQLDLSSNGQDGQDQKSWRQEPWNNVSGTDPSSWTINCGFSRHINRVWIESGAFRTWSSTPRLNACITVCCFTFSITIWASLSILMDFDMFSLVWYHKIPQLNIASGFSVWWFRLEGYQSFFVKDQIIF